MTNQTRLRTAALVLVALVVGVGVGLGVVGVGVFDDAGLLADGSASVSDQSDVAAASTETPAPTPADVAPSESGIDAAPTRTPRPEAANATWEEYRLVATFRNDDVKPADDPSAMRAVDRIFVEEGVPVTSGVIPYPGGTPLSEATATCEYLRELATSNPNTVEFALHGYTHENRSDFYGASEFGGAPYDTQREWIRAGTAELTACTGERPTTFVPPMNSYDRNTTRALTDADYSVVSGGSWFTEPYYGERGVFRADGIVHAGNTTGYVTDWSTVERKSRAELRADFDRAYRHGGTYMLMLHPQHFDTAKRRGDLRAHVRYVRSHEDVRLMTVGELGLRLAKGTMKRTEDGWRVLEPSD
jgi:peptidoglycan/xylan/chitin deacetylase (PgdA/CDA1 family)